MILTPWILVSYYTKDSLYEKYASGLIKSLKKHKVNFHVEGIKSLGSWELNTSYKPSFIIKMCKKFPDYNIVWVDCDASLNAYPGLFTILDCDIAAFEFSWKKYYGKTNNFEMLSGTLFFKNNEFVLDILNKWKDECQKFPKIWDQKHLEKVVEGKYFRLPEQYCQIFDSMKSVKNPIITHHQASREFRRLVKT
jgi:hypothetical protein